ncbi:MAG: glycoside hydrolase family 5 protein [Polyangiaceae bacterium]|nr:glycoside hydrolase family 5 protein [Polyangiaceae bacterium]
MRRALCTPVAALVLACGGGGRPASSDVAGAAGQRGEGGSTGAAGTSETGGTEDAAGDGNRAGGNADGECTLGEEGCDCFPNKTCYGTLRCYSMLCVDAGDGAAGTGTERRGAGAGGQPDDPHAGGLDARQGGAGGAASPGDGAGAPNVGGTGGAGPSTGGATGAGTGGQSTGSRPIDVHDALHVEDTALVDASGAPVTLQGISGYWTNWQTWHPEQNAAALRWLRDHWNVSVVRAAMGVGPEEGGYLEEPSFNRGAVEAAIAAAVDAGIYVIVDWHDHVAHTHASEAEEFFKSIAETYGHLPNVLYETYNEPLETASWADDVKPYHERIVATIRERDPDNVILLGSPSWSQDVDVAAADPVAGEDLMYTLHFYACTHQDEIRAKASQALSLGLPLFVTEWGATSAEKGEETWVCEVEAQLWQDWMNAHSISSLAWSLCSMDTEANCIVRPSTSDSGNWDARLAGHGPFVRDKLQGYDYDCNNPRLIDTLEDGDDSICPSSGRNGVWFVANDGTGTQAPSDNSDIPVTLSSPRGKSTVAAHSSGTGFSDWGAVVGVTLVEGDDHLEYFDATSFGGVRFHARGSGTVLASITTGRTKPAPDGYCEPDACNHPFRATVTLGDGWVPNLLPFDGFKSNVLGAMTAQDRKEILTIEFLATSDDFDLWVDDLGFY